ncbi:unnamed protein product [Allacma fusca]|uniref:Elongator complex protein 5 n=1 Tax=Allacma fusca TaxID=39272 RepID=A0A8J2LPI3_9HEXA|nr:unnamed protein product [Allacma fusca]
MVGFAGVLRKEFQSKFCFIVGEDRPALWSLHYLSKLLNDHSDEQHNFIHLLSFVHRNVPMLANVKAYDFIRNDYTNIGQLFTELISNAEPSKKNILILDDLAVFSIFNNGVSGDMYSFFKQVSKVYAQVIVFCTVDTICKDDIALLCGLAEHVVILKNPHEEESQEFLCNLLSIKPSGKTTLEQTYFEVKDRCVINSEKKVDKGKVAGDTSDDIMRTLTTFKLTIEDSEKESKNQLYLPYLDAQRTTVPDTSEDFYDDDDEDEDD